MKFYSFDEIKKHGDCVRFVTEVLGLKVQNDRCQARWRGGDGWNVALTKETWYDHRTEKGGGLLQLCAEAMFGGNIHQAQEKLGEWLGLTVRQKTVKLENNGTRYEQLVADGYKEYKRYDYRDLEGNIVHTVIRMEHKTKSKEFIQRTPDHPGLGDTKTILYNLKGWVASPWVAIVEGEKDAETLRSLGLVQYRVRHHDTLARIEAPGEEIEKLVIPDPLGGLGLFHDRISRTGRREGEAPAEPLSVPSIAAEAASVKR